MNASAAIIADRLSFDPADRGAPLMVAQQRLMVIMILFMIVTAVIGARLVQLCLFHHNPHASGPAAPAARGEILDRNGAPLATTIRLWAIGINPRQVLGDRNALADKLAALMPERDVAAYRRIVFGRRFMYLRRPASPALARAVQALGEPAIKLAPEPHRLFPQASLAGHVLGYSQTVLDPRSKHEVLTGIGVERYFDPQLSKGEPITLALDVRVQAAMETELARRMAETSAIGAAGVVLDVDTGEVLAMASLPDINPNAPLRSARDANNRDMINKVTQGVYELGSTFKMLTFANAIGSGVLTDMSKTYDVSHQIVIGRFKIHDDEPKFRPLTVPEVMTFSSNIGTAQIAEQLGPERIVPFFRKFGLDKRTDIELRERAQPLFPRDWGKTTVLTTSYGHGISVTPLHMAQAFAALANGGILHPATLLKHQPGAPVPGTRVITEATSARIRQLMRLVVLQGTGTNANAPGLRVGGKTGTAEKIAGHGYNKTSNITTFAGVFPMDHPRYVVLTTLDDAKASKATYGFRTAGWMVAPLAKRVIARIGPLLGVRPDLSKDIDVSDLWPLLLEKKPAGKNEIE